MKTLIQALLLVPVVLIAAAASDLEKLQTSFMARYDEANATRDEQIKKLESSYLAALERHLDKVKGSGDLKVVVPVRDEIEAMKADPAALPSLKDGADADLKSMRAKYAAARDGVQRKRAFPETVVTVIIRADGKEVFEEKLDWENDEARIDIEFDPASAIEIEVDGGGRRPAWIYWTDFESR